ncbi:MULTISPECIES: hypothetical protein [unclassified Gemella]|uniref:hypothetical protein n=1 Tax=unclassified Gemella TaxID=2624949 RepID=UPI001C040DF8|nr:MULTISPECIES: hypothetical protein [unclassified Gemella]MBU0278193.1 hypothetical protein [Gemella sp. zg-1178]QWQ38850.1 hypothetical protein KMP11_00340 [Gemella sp. zg-570]
MTTTQKILKLNYTLEKAAKQVKKAHSFEISPEISKEEAKEVGILMSTIISDNIEDYAMQVTEAI